MDEEEEEMESKSEKRMRLKNVLMMNCRAQRGGLDSASDGSCLGGWRAD